LERAAETLLDKFSAYLDNETADNSEEMEKPPLIQLTILCDHVFDVPIQSSTIPLSQYELAVVELLGRLDDILYSRKSLNLSDGLSFAIEVVDAPTEEDDYEVTPPIRGGGRKKKENEGGRRRRRERHRLLAPSNCGRRRRRRRG
jgi:hypothetical protein